MSNEVLNMLEKVNILEEVSGHSIDVLISLFAKGYTPTEPVKPMTLSDLNKDILINSSLKKKGISNMGRTERRMSERRNRLDSRKNKILINPHELNQMKKDIAYKATGYKTEALMTCFALVMSRLGLADDTICDAISSIDKLMNDILTDTTTIEDYKKELEEKTGIIVKCED